MLFARNGGEWRTRVHTNTTLGAFGVMFVVRGIIFGRNKARNQPLPSGVSYFVGITRP